MNSTLQSRRRIVTLLRWVMFIALAYLVWASGEGTVALRAGLLGVVALSNIVLSRLRLATWEHPALLPVVATVDISVLLGAMVSGPGFARDFFFAYFIILAVVGLASSLRWAIVGTTLAVAGYGGILGLEHGIVLLQTPSLIGRLGFLFSIGVGYGGLIEASRARLRETLLQQQLLGWVDKLRTAFSDDFDANDVIRQVLVDIQDVYPGNVRASLVQLGDETMQVISSSDDQEVRELELSAERYPELMQAVETREPIVIDDLRSDSLTESVRELVSDLPFNSLLLCPVNLEDPTIGHVVLRVARQSGAFSPSIVNTTQHVAEAIGAVFRQAKMREAMERSEKMEMVSQIAMSVSHSFNDILSTVLLSAESLRKQATRHAASGVSGPFDEESMSRFETIELSVKEGLTIVERLAAWTQVDGSTPQELNGQAIEPRAILEEAWKYARPHWARREATRGLELKLEVEETRAVEGSQPELREVLLNLMINAVDAMPKGGTMTLRLREVGEQVVFSVEDTGTGMSEETLERIFDPLFTTKGKAGTGLGLPTAQSVADRHGGKLSAKSQEGVGSCFTLALPASSKTVGADTQSETAGDDTGAAANQRVLLVEPNELVRDVMLRVLQGAGLHVDVVADLDEAEVMLGTDRAYCGLVVDAAVGGDDLPDFLGEMHTMDPELAARVLLYSNGGMTTEMKELQQTFGVSCVDRSAGLAVLSDALGIITARDSAAA